MTALDQIPTPATREAEAERPCYPVVPSFRPDGSVLDLANLRPEDIDFAVMAEGLSKIARFNGTPRGPAYSVAQHSVMGADAIFHESRGDIDLAGDFLLHDGHEYLLGDQTRPTQQLLGIFLFMHAGIDRRVVTQAIVAMKQSVDGVIAAAARRPTPSPDAALRVADMDERMLRATRRTVGPMRKWRVHFEDGSKLDFVTETPAEAQKQAAAKVKNVPIRKIKLVRE